jgi:hypothetical protein
VDDWSLRQFDEANVRWFVNDGSQDDDEIIRCVVPEDDIDSLDDWFVPCEIISFGTYIESVGHYSLPADMLRPATTNDLVQRLLEISEQIVSHGWLGRNLGSNMDYELEDLLFEREFIRSEVKRREEIALKDLDKAKKVFLCHSSEDKHLVRKVRNDLADIGHTVWLDEDQIDVGDSIVEAISEATAKCQFLVIFISVNSNRSRWVKKEWQAFLSRSLERCDCKVLPVLVEEAEIPQILYDIKYANFGKSYNAGFSELAKALSR